MKQLLTIPAAVVLSLLLSVPTSSIRAQSTSGTSESGQDHTAHHPESSQAAAPASSPMLTTMGGQQIAQSGDGMMMGGDMGAMMSMMHGCRMMGGMPFEHVEGRIAFLKTELRITDAQEPQWNKFADAVRSVAQSMKAMHQQMMPAKQMMQGGQMMQASRESATARLDRYERMLTARLEAVRSIKAAFDPLYAVLSDEQKKTADELFGHMGVI